MTVSTADKVSTAADKVSAAHVARNAYLYVRRSTLRSTSRAAVVIRSVKPARTVGPLKSTRHPQPKPEEPAAHLRHGVTKGSQHQVYEGTDRFQRVVIARRLLQ